MLAPDWLRFTWEIVTTEITEQNRLFLRESVVILAESQIQLFIWEMNRNRGI